MKIWLLLAALLSIVPGVVSPASAAPKASDLVQAELLAEPDAIRPGEPFTVAVKLTTREHWHTYWRNPGDSGLATEIAWALPAGFAAGPIEWPAPQRIPVSHLVNYAFEGETYLLARITPPTDLAAGDAVSLDATVSYLVCERECIPGEAKVSTTLRVAGPAEAAPVDPASRAAFDAARAKLPTVSPWPALMEASGDILALKLAAPNLRADAIRSAYFFPYDETALDHAAPQTLAVGPDGLTLTLKPSALAGDKAARPDGVLVIDEALDGRVVRQAFALGDAAAPGGGSAKGEIAPAPDTSWAALARAALFAMLGGLVLNLMPCVFPVLSIKVISLAKHSGLSPRLVRLNGLVYAAGVVASFLALAAVLMLVRAGGAELGWGFQLQSPAIVAGLACLMLALGLNLSGAAEFGTSLAGIGGGLASRSGLSGSFFTGVLATIVATPCTAPFMGAALGYALTAPAAEAFVVFAALGIGMSLPFLVLTVAPSLASRLPRPGGWMEILKQVLAFPLYLTAAWLVFVLSQQVGPSGLFAGLVALVAVAFGLWALKAGAWTEGWPRRLSQGTALASLAVLAGLLVMVERDRGTAGAVASSGSAAIQPFTQARLDGLRAEGRPVFVNLTAAWCITCAVNERVALSSEAVRSAMTSRDITYLKGDWTNQNPEITRILENNGRSGVPLYLLYSGSGDPVVLPQILTEGVVLDELGKVGANPGRRASL